MIQNHNVTIIRINLVDSDFSTYRLINQIYMHISKLTNKQIEEKNKKIKE